VQPGGPVGVEPNMPLDLEVQQVWGDTLLASRWFSASDPQVLVGGPSADFVVDADALPGGNDWPLAVRGASGWMLRVPGEDPQPVTSAGPTELTLGGSRFVVSLVDRPTRDHLPRLGNPWLLGSITGALGLFLAFAGYANLAGPAPSVQARLAAVRERRLTTPGNPLSPADRAAIGQALAAVPLEACAPGGDLVVWLHIRDGTVRDAGYTENTADPDAGPCVVDQLRDLVVGTVPGALEVSFPVWFAGPG
jgi:hypothetical protein